jgi:hypothetical protein
MQYVCGRMSRAAQKRNPGRGSQRLHRALGGTRILLAAAPTAPPCFCRWQRSSLLHRGFPPPDYSAGRCCSNPPLQPLFKADKTETPVPGSDTGVLGGRVWIARAALLKTAHWAVFALSSATAPQLFESTLAAPFSRQVKQKLRYPLDTGVLGGRGWIRTTEAESSRFTVCPHWPLGNTPIFIFAVVWTACICYH